MKQKNTTQIIVNKNFGWTKVHQIYIYSIWKTPTKYVVCSTYLYQYYYFDTLQDAISKVKSIVSEECN